MAQLARSSSGGLGQSPAVTVKSAHYKSHNRLLVGFFDNGSINSLERTEVAVKLRHVPTWTDCLGSALCAVAPHVRMRRSADRTIAIHAVATK